MSLIASIRLLLQVLVLRFTTVLLLLQAVASPHLHLILVVLWSQLIRTLYLRVFIVQKIDVRLPTDY